MKDTLQEGTTQITHTSRGNDDTPDTKLAKDLPSEANNNDKNTNIVVEL
jgi:hypothetical protein